MRRLLCSLACLLFALVIQAGPLLADGSPADQGLARPAAKEAKPKAGRPKKGAEKPKAAAAKPKGAAKKTAAKAKDETEAEAEPSKAEAAVAKEKESEETKKEAEPKPTLASKQKKPGAETAETVAVKRDLVKVEVSLDGVFEAQRMHELSIRPETWMSFEVVKAVEHGKHVSKGDVLVEFDTKKIDEALADQRTSVGLGKLSLKQAETNLRLLETATPLELASAERNKRNADEDAARFTKSERQMNERVAKYNLQLAQESLDNEKEELAQLEKMYKADDITEQTEEIVLKRQRERVKLAEFLVELGKFRCEQDLNISLPRMDEMYKENAKTAGLADQRAKASLPAALERARLELERLKLQETRDEEKLAKLEKDRSAMTIEAPADGVVYYGRSERGKWNGVTAAADDLRPGSNVSPNQVFMTIVSPRPVTVRVSVPERQFHWIRPGLKGTIEPAGFPDARLAATVDQVEAIPYNAGSFGAVLKVSLRKDDEAIVPGMACTAKFLPYVQKQALVVPASAVEADKLDSRKHFVYLPGKAGKPVRRAVTVGQKMEDRLEILKGLDEGDKVLKEIPDDEDE